MARARFHRKHSQGMLAFLQENKKTFRTEKTSTGFPTFKVGQKEIYFREKRSGPGSVNKISQFQYQVGRSALYKYVDQFDVKTIEEESNKIEKTLMYKGFFFDPINEPKIEGAIKIDLDTAYWQTCRYVRMINKSLYRQIIKHCTKGTRLKITGTLGKRVIVTDYDKGVRKPSFIREEAKRRIVFQNIYNRIRKFVDELMVWVWMKNPQNFIGFYVDCFWIREFDIEIISKIQQMFDIKMDVVDVEIEKNGHGRYYISDTSRESGEITPYDAQFKYNNFVNYNFFHNFSPEFKSINFKTQWTTEHQM